MTARHRIVFQGVTGVGKSTLANLLAAYAKTNQNGSEYNLREKFPTSDSVDSKTSHMKRLVVGDIIIDDAPGLRDTSGGDEKHFKELKTSLTEEPFSALVFVIDAGNCRSHTEIITERMVRITKLFGKKILEHCVMVTTKFSEKNMTAQYEKMEKIFAKVYNQCGARLCDLSTHMFCLECDPENLQNKTIMEMSVDILDHLLRTRETQCRAILDFARLRKAFTQEDHELPITAITPCEHIAIQAPKRKLSEVSFGQATPAKLKDAPKIDVALKNQLNKQQQQRKQSTQAQQLRSHKFPDQETQEQLDLVQAFIHHTGIKCTTGAFLGVQVLRPVWKKFCDKNTTSARPFDVLAGYLEREGCVQLDAKFCKNCRQIRDSKALRGTKQQTEFQTCRCLSKNNFCKRKIVVGAYSPSITIDIA